MQRTHEKGVPAGIAVPMSRQAKMAWVVSPCMRISGHGGAQLHVYVHQHVGADVQTHQLRAACGAGVQAQQSHAGQQLYAGRA